MAPPSDSRPPHDAPDGPTAAPDAAPSWFGQADDGAIAELRWAGPAEPAPAVEARVERVWPPIGLRRLAERPPGDVELLVEMTGDRHEREVTFDDGVVRGGLATAESGLSLFAAERLDGVVAVHAAVLVWDGAAVLVPGTSHAGKSTLTVAASRAGALVATDEYALVDPGTGLVQGWVRPVRTRTPDGLEHHDLAVPIPPTPVAVVAAVRYTDETPEQRRLTQGETAFELLANTVCAQSRPEESLAAAAAIARVAIGIGGTRGEAADTVGDLVELCREWRGRERPD